MRGNRAFRVDSNHHTIVAAFEAEGCAVESLAIVGGGFPDLLVCPFPNAMLIPRITFLVEVKDGSKSPSKRLLTDKEQAFHARWPGPVYTVESVDEVRTLLAAYRTSGHER